MKAPIGKLFLISSATIVFAFALHAQGKFVYTNNDDPSSNSVSAFAVGTNGVLTQVPGSPYPTGGTGLGGGFFAVTRITTAAGKFLYASNGADSTIAGFSINTSTGALAQLPGSPYLIGVITGMGDISLASSPDGKFLFAGAAANNTIVSFQIAADGALTQAATTSVPAPPTGMKVSNSGTLLLVGLPAYFGGAVTSFTIAANGGLTMADLSINLAMSANAGRLTGVEMNCAGNRLFSGEMIQGPATVDVFDIAAIGTIARIPGAPFSPAQGGGTNSSFGVLSPDDSRLFITNQDSATVTVFGVDIAGALAPIPGSPFAIGGTTPAGAATDNSGSLLFVASSPNFVNVFNVAANGALTPAAGSPFTTGQTGGALTSLAVFPPNTCGVTPPAPEPPPVTPPPPPVIPPPPPPNPPTGTPKVVKIDIKPDGEGNRINVKEHKKIKVAIFSSKDLNAPAQLDISSLTFGHSGTEQSLAGCTIRREGHERGKRFDVVCRFYTAKTKFEKSDLFGTLKGRLKDGSPIIGRDFVYIVR